MSTLLLAPATSTPAWSQDREKSAPDLTGADAWADLENRLGGFKEKTGELANVEPEKRAAALKVDTVFAWDVRRNTPYLGLGVVVAERGKLRLSLVGANDRLGVGVGWKVIPVVDVTVGATLFWDFEKDDPNGSVYVSIFQW